MTICKVLATERRDNDEVTAYEKRDVWSNAPARYEIVVSRDGFAYLVDKAARTTWKKRFNEMAGIER